MEWQQGYDLVVPNLKVNFSKSFFHRKHVKIGLCTAAEVDDLVRRFLLNLADGIKPADLIDLVRHRNRADNLDGITLANGLHPQDVDPGHECDRHKSIIGVDIE